LETIRIVRRVENGQVHEVLESLNGPVRVVEREEDRVICRLSDDRPIAVHGQGLDAELLRPKPVDLDKLAPHYVVHPLGEARVAGRQTDVVGIIPRDQLRYGYRFYVDAESGLPLKSDLMGGEAKPIEQIIFTSLTLLPGQTPRPATQAATAADVSPAAPVRSDTGPWRFAGMPPGFHLVLVDRPAGAAEDSTEHYVLSDGLASVSIYIERDVEDGLQGGSRIGAVHAVGGRIAGHQVTVVGEVPAATVEQVLAGIERREPVTE
jgi:sigma-E factor negative regulatory protein RseB